MLFIFNFQFSIFNCLSSFWTSTPTLWIVAERNVLCFSFSIAYPHFGHPLPSFWTALNHRDTKTQRNLFLHFGHFRQPCVEPFLARRHPAVAELTRELARHKGFLLFTSYQSPVTVFTFWTIWTHVSRTSKAISRTKARRHKVFFTIHQLPVTSHSLYILNILDPRVQNHPVIAGPCLARRHEGTKKSILPLCPPCPCGKYPGFHPARLCFELRETLRLNVFMVPCFVLSTWPLFFPAVAGPASGAEPSTPAKRALFTIRGFVN